ncbi:predicted MFS family arabinose efflux permease [Streptomyces sp. TLI_55]|uniref:MFS transporter n=1 Tax=Streptomyces sp. TLI_55 TaxID=1938861 RepID=UPI000BC965CB|nr:MFS transporter [Streptomyces sp. TLI_55]SNX55940.1 predicted MFS family arabinose efflux permease [Streptomyces sp. TLI_55]
MSHTASTQHRPVTPTRRTATRPRAGARRHGIGFGLVAFAFLTAMAFSTVPTPLYPLYTARDGFSTFMVTVVFAVYAVGVVVSLLLAGHVSDWVGRKKILLPALALELLAAVLFLTGTALPVLLAARFITGLGVGMITATATAHLQELHAAHRPQASTQRFELVSTGANIGGLGVGALVAGLLAQFVAVPLRTPYLVFAVLLVLAMVAVALAPETVEEQFVRPSYRPQRISLDTGDRAGYLVAAAGAFASFAVFGLFTSVAPGFVAGTLHHPSRALAGAIVFMVFGGAATAQSLTSRLSTTAKSRLGQAAQAVGVVTLVAGMHTADLAAFLAGGVVAGIGAGVLFKASLGTVAALAVPEHRGEALAGLFLIAYLGLTIPAIGIGVATLGFSSVTVMTWFAAILLAVLALIALSGRRTSLR